MNTACGTSSGSWIGRQLDEPHAVGVLAGALPAGPQGELGLADAAGAGERQQPGRGQRALEVGQALTAAHEARQFDWQVAGRLAGSGGRQGPPSVAPARRGSKAGDGVARATSGEIRVGLSTDPDGRAPASVESGPTDGPDSRSPIGRKDDHDARPRSRRDHRNNEHSGPQGVPDHGLLMPGRADRVVPPGRVLRGRRPKLRPDRRPGHPGRPGVAHSRGRQLPASICAGRSRTSNRPPCRPKTVGPPGPP